MIKITPKIYLKNAELFSDLKEETIEKISQICILNKYKKKKIVFFQGSNITGFYILVRGKAKISNFSKDGKEYILKILKPGDVCAEAIIFTEEFYPVTLSTLEECLFIFIPKNKFFNLLKTQNDISLELIGVLSKRLNYLLNIIKDLSLKEVPARLAKFLIDQAISQNVHLKKNIEFILDIPKHQIAASIGTIPETLSRILTKFKKNKIIEIKKNVVKIKDINKLYEISAGKKIKLS